MLNVLDWQCEAVRSSVSAEARQDGIATRGGTLFRNLFSQILTSFFLGELFIRNGRDGTNSSFTDALSLEVSSGRCFSEEGRDASNCGQDRREWESTWFLKTALMRVLSQCAGVGKSGSVSQPPKHVLNKMHSWNHSMSKVQDLGFCTLFWASFRLHQQMGSPPELFAFCGSI